MASASVRNVIKRALPSSLVGILRTIKNAAAYTLQWVMDKCGFVVARKNDYYSPLPSREAMKATMSRWIRPSSLAGVDYNLDAMKVFCEDLLRTYGPEFDTLIAYKDILQVGFGPGYTPVDARILYAMLRAKKPKRYLEVGSGISTFYASLAARRNAEEGHPMEITCIEPYPFAALDTIPGITLIQKEVQDVPVDFFTSLGSDDVFFIDSSHIVRLDGDVPFLFLEVLPALNSGPLIHIHDIPFPFHCPYPANFWIYKSVWPMWWNESMLLHALLSGSKAFSMVLSAPLIRHHDEPFLQNLIPGYQTVEEEPNAFSAIWLQKM